MSCNTELKDIDREEAAPLVPPRVTESQKDFRRCPGCARLYWQGSHYERMQRIIEHTLGD